MPFKAISLHVPHGMLEQWFLYSLNASIHYTKTHFSTIPKFHYSID